MTPVRGGIAAAQEAKQNEELVYSEGTFPLLGVSRRKV
jgi:hypothetical protein